MRILKILVEVDGYKKPEQSVVLADTENVREYIESNIFPQVNKPVYFDHELFVQVYVIDGATEHDLIPQLLAKYYLEKYCFCGEGIVAWSVEWKDGGWCEVENNG